MEIDLLLILLSIRLFTLIVDNICTQNQNRCDGESGTMKAMEEDVGN